MTGSLVSIVLPVHNQGDHVAEVVREYEEGLARLPVPYEMVLVVNGSTDSSLAVCRKMEGANPRVKVLESIEGGWGRAVLLGLGSARGDLLCYTNLARTRAEDLTLLLLYGLTHPDVVVKANRKIRDSLYRRFGSLLFNLECRALFDLSFWDINGTPKVFPRTLGKLLALSREDDLVDLEFHIICRDEGYRVLEVPIFSNVRHGGRSTTSHRSALALYWGSDRDVARAETSMKAKPAAWARHDAAWRDPGAVLGHWEEAGNFDPALLRFRARGDFWEILEGLEATLLVTREYEHLVIGLTVEEGRPLATFLRLPHPSGLAYDRERRVLHLASTRNPNQIFELAPAAGSRALVPVSARFYPGRLYLHDLALIGGELHANAVGQNLVVRVEASGGLSPVWWPRCVEASRKPLTDRNHIQLNSIAPGRTLAESFFTASTDQIGPRKPGHRDFPVDGRGVVFSGRIREPVARGLTRPHSARLHEGRLFVANSGYGEVGIIENGRFHTIARLPGWTRGLTFLPGVAFAGTSRVIPRFSRYAPGLDPEASRCALHALDVRSGKVLGSLDWPAGNQIFAIEWAPRRAVSGFPFGARRRSTSKASKDFFYSFQIDGKASP